MSVITDKDKQSRGIEELSPASTYTPGPWEVDQSGAGLEISPAGSIHAITILKHGDLPNARLISAAPELLEALERILAFYKPVNHDTRKALQGEDNNCTICAAEAAIRKARAL